jgi:hypothetical protein
MSESKKGRMNDSDYPEPDKILKTIVHVILTLIVFFAVYIFFAKTEWNS